MGIVYALCGPSGVGKTTFLTRLQQSGVPPLRPLVRSTVRPKRPHEIEGIEYDFYSYESFLHNVYAGDFAHIEQYAAALYGIEYRKIYELIQSQKDGIIMAGIYGAATLKALFGDQVHVVYMHVDQRRTLHTTECFQDGGECVAKLERRLRKKISEGIVSLPPDEVEAYVAERMRLNFLDMAYVNGKIRQRQDIWVLENLDDQMERTLENFLDYRTQTCRLNSDENEHGGLSVLG